MQKKNTSNTKKLGLFGLVTVATLGATALANAETYTVQKGDTLSAIAKKNGTTVDEIVSKNGIQDANKISIGQNLTINETTEETTEPSATTAAASVVAEGSVVSSEPSATTEAAAESTQSTESTQSEDTQATNTNLSSSEAAAKEEIAQRESSGSYTAQNGQYYGRYQLASSYLNGDLSPENQEKVADNYVASRYGSWTAALAFWNANGWY